MANDLLSDSSTLPLILNQKSPSRQRKETSHVELVNNNKPERTFSVASELAARVYNKSPLLGMDDIMSLSRIKNPSAPQRGKIHSSINTESRLEIELERTRALFRESQCDLARTRNENILLRKIDRRYQRELESIEEKKKETPDLIQSRNMIINQTKAKQEILYLNDLFQKSKSEVSALQSILNHNDLRLRYDLEKEIAQANATAENSDKCLREFERKAGLMEKNISVESRNLRAKISALQFEICELGNQISGLERQIRDKDREIITLYVYKYNAMHRKQKKCKECANRDNKEKEIKRLSLLHEFLPILNSPKAEFIKMELIRVTVHTPLLSEFCNYDMIELRCNCGILGNELFEVFQLFPESKNYVILDVKKFPVGDWCHLSCVPCVGTIRGKEVKAKEFLFDVPPAIPQAPEIRLKLDRLKPAIKIKIKSALVASGGSDVLLFRVFRAYGISCEQSRKTVGAFEKIGEVKAQLVTQLNSIILSEAVFNILNPRLGYEHYICISGLNSCGESERSRVQGPCVIDFVPDIPSIPTVRRQGQQSAVINFSRPPSRGESDILRYRVTCQIAGKREPVCVVYSVTREIIVDNLEFGSLYSFSVAAENSAGWSGASSASQCILLEKLLPRPMPPTCIIISASKIRCLIGAMAEGEEDSGQFPPIEGYLLFISRHPPLSFSDSPLGLNNGVVESISDSNTAKKQIEKIDLECNIASKIEKSQSFNSGEKTVLVHRQPGVHMSEHIFNDLDRGACYWISVSLIGKDQESPKSHFVWVCLAAALPLPESPSVNSLDDFSKCKSVIAEDLTTTKIVPFSKYTSKSIDLSHEQRIQNMFKGNPAYSIPDELKSQAEIDGVRLVVNYPVGKINHLFNWRGRERNDSFILQTNNPNNSLNDIINVNQNFASSALMDNNTGGQIHSTTSSVTAGTSQIVSTSKKRKSRDLLTTGNIAPVTTNLQISRLIRKASTNNTN